MIFVLNIDNFNKNYILIGQREANLINYYNNFYKIYYSVDDYTMYGISIKMEFVKIKNMSYYNYVKLNFNVSTNIDIINTIRDIERYILSKINKTIKYNLYNDLCKGFIKVQQNENNSLNDLILRITGVWEDNVNCGISYKFVYM
jgi:hypothetical protein